MGLIKHTNYERSEKILKYVIMQVKPLSVVIPFMNALNSLMKTQRLRVRGDIDKILAFITFYHWLHAKKLPVVRMNDKSIMFANPEITMEAIDIIHEPLINMLSGIEAGDLQVLNGLERMGKTEKEDEINKEDIQNLMKNLGFTSERSIRDRLKKLEDSGHFTSEGGVRGKPKVFYLSDQISKIKLETSQVLAYSGDWNTRRNVILQMAKEGYNYLKPILESPEVVEEYEKLIKRLSQTNNKNAKDVTLPQGRENEETIQSQNEHTISKEGIHSGGEGSLKNNEKSCKKNYSKNSINQIKIPAQSDRLKAVFELGRKLTQGGEYFTPYEIEIKLNLPEDTVGHDLLELAKAGKISEVATGRWTA